MANIEEDLKKVVNVKKVVKAVKNIGRFALYRSSEDSTLLITTSFILNLNDEQAWEIQCALLVKTLGKWYGVVKGEPVEERPVKQEEIDLYFKSVNDTELNIIGFTGLYLGNVALYAEDGGYVGIDRSYVEMVGSPAIRKTARKDIAIASEFHVISPMKFKDNDYLRPLLF
jgi:hypothetical protein